MTRLEFRVHELTVGQLAERSGVAVSALHFYEAKGLISSRRTAGNQRRFSRDALRRVSFIKVSQRVGIPLSEIKRALATLPEERTPTVADWARLSETWKTDLDDRIAQLQKLRDDLTECIGCGCLSINKCALTNPYDQLGDEGPGPRRLLVRHGDAPHADGAQSTPSAPSATAAQGDSQAEPCADDIC
ncbi:redox-sensitive transcriptional activator SoxR [Actinomadura hibisca]|uniref:redox-sensitive transcriptional activator SoxR n=1 Tax=Actinomadura hibisca TaxID=68565 RepID=UPI00083763B9|nr:redox-sensitive transcriptional activator SoxR [Actinomadura hibisca]